MNDSIMNDSIMIKILLDQNFVKNIYRNVEVKNIFLRSSRFARLIFIALKI